jgi:hypothetical protein
MSIRRKITNHTLKIALVLFIIGIILTILGIYGVFIYDSKVQPGEEGAPPEFVINLMKGVGDWIYWCVLAGPLILIAGGWYFFDNIQKRKEFNELMATTSKAKFIRNLDRAEFLAWKLTMNHQTQLIDKKKEFHIKK